MQYPLDELRQLVLSRQWDEVIKSCKVNELLLSDREKIYYIRALYELRRFNDCIKLCEKFDSLSERYTRSLKVFKLRSLNGLEEENKSKRFAEEMTQEVPLSTKHIFFLQDITSPQMTWSMRKNGVQIYLHNLERTMRDLDYMHES